MTEKPLSDEEFAYAEATDLPVERLVPLAIMTANKKIKEGFNVDIHFKHTCEKCHCRMMFEQPNMVYQEVECGNCGHKQPFKKGGFSMIYKFNDPVKGYKGDGVDLDSKGKSGDTVDVGQKRAKNAGGVLGGVFRADTGEKTG